MLKKLRHIGVVAEDLEKAVEKFKGFGFALTEIKEDKKMDISVAFLSIGDTSIEFISHKGPDKGDDPLIHVVLGQKGTINHLCFEVDDLETSIRSFERAGAKLVESCPRSGAHGRIAFFYPETTEGILIELCEI